MQEINDALLKKAVQFGCVVTISYKDQKGTEFFVLSEGFTNIKMRMRTAADIQQRGIMSQCLFRLIPTLAYTEYNKGKQKFDEQQPGIVNQRQARQVLPKQIKAMEAETQINAEQYSKLKGQSIFYGQSIQLQHVDSEKYLSFSQNKGAQYENDGQLAYLKSEHGEDTFFKILSSFSFQQETGGYIFDGDTISIVSTCDQLSEPGLHASQPKKSEVENKLPKLELNVSTPSYLKINIFSKPSDEQQFLSVFDCFWITYSEQNLNLIVQKFTPDQDKKYLKFLAGDDGDSGDSNGMFVIENTQQSDFSKGGYVRWTEKYRIKHLTSGYYLATQKYKSQDKKLRTLIAVQDIKKASEFRFELIYATIGTKNKELALQFLERDSFFRLIAKNKYIAKCGLDPDEVYQIEGQDYIEQIQIPTFQKEKKDDNVLKLNRIDDNDVRLTRYLLSCMKSISRSDQYLEKEITFDAEGKELYITLMEKSTALMQNINALEALCFNRLDGYVLFEGGYGQSSERIQTLLREQYFFETLVRILVICFKSVAELKKNYVILSNVSSVLNDNNNKKLLEDQVFGRCLQKKREICQQVYKLIAAMCHTNQQNQEYASKYLPIFVMQSLYLDNMSTIITIIKDYEELLLNLSKNVMIDQMNNNKQEKRKRKNTQTKQVVQIASKQDDYDSEYSKLAQEILDKQARVSVKWDLLGFYSSMLASSKDFTKKIQIIKFLRQAVQLDQHGINVNQELSYKNIVANDADVFKNEVLVRIKSDGPQLKVYRNGDEATLLEYFDKHNKKDPQIYPSFVPYIQELMQLYSWMCNSRNYTWKKFVENFFNVESLIENIEEPQYTMEIRGIICNMLNKLYVDQEPRRIIVWPELCKVVRIDSREKKLNNSQISQMKINKVTQEDPVDLTRVQQKIKSYLKYMDTKIGQNSGYYDENPSKREEIAVESSEIYNSLTLEVMKLFNLMINFGLYVVDIKSGATKEIIFNDNKEYFDNLRCIISLLEFDVMFPESRKILMELREEEDLKKNSLKLPNINLNFNDIGFGLFDDQVDEKKQKKIYIDEDVADPSQELSFQKQVEVLKLKMTEYMYASVNQAAQIKAEVCEILNQFLDVRMDFLLKNLNNLFTDWVKADELQNKLNDDEDHENIKEIFRKHIKESIAVILPNIMLTGTSVDQDLKPKEDNLPNFDNFINVVRDKQVDKNNELTAIDLHVILGFSIFPVLIQNFCLNEDLVLETKNLQLMTRLYNQRYEFADLSSKLLVLFDAKNIHVYKKSKKRIVELAKFIDESETWVQGLDRDEHMRTLRLVHEQFEYFSKLMYTGSEIDRDGVVVESHLKKIDPVRQDIMRHLKLDKLGVNLIKDAVFAVDQVDDPDRKQKLKDMFIVCLNFLTLFVKDNPNNQMEMSQNITALVSNLSTDIGQVQLLCEIFRNNKKICTERAHEVIDDFIKLILTNGRQARYLDFFLIVQSIKKEYIPTNQKAVLNLLIDPRFKDQLFYMVKQAPSFAKRRDYPVFDFKQRRDFDEPYIYHAKLIEVCASCTIGKDGLLSAENKLKQQITFTYIIELLLSEDHFTVNMETDVVQEDEESNEQEMMKQAQLFEQSALRQQGSPQVSPRMRVLDPHLITLMKPALQDLLFYTYLESEKIDEEVFKCMNEIVELIKKERYRLKTMTSCIPEYQSYLFNNLMLTINGFIKVFNRELGQQAIQQGSSLQKAVVKFQQEIDLFRTVIIQLLESGKFRLNDRQKKLFELFKSETIMQEIDNNDRTLPDEPIVRKSDTTKKDETWKELWNIFLKEFLDSEILMKSIQEEQVTFAKAILSVEEVYIKKKKDNKDDHKKTLAAQINKEQIFKGLIAFLENNSGKQEMRDTFKLILNSLQNYLSIVKLEDNLDEIEEQQAREDQLEENQNFLNYNNAMQMTLTLISGDSDIINELVQFGIQLLHGGNRNVQVSVWQFFQNFSHSERFFERMSNILKSATVFKSGEQPKFAFQQQTDLTKNVLRFLQLFAEGHYTELQEYMHEQTLNHHSYDIFENIVELLVYYLKNPSRDNYDNMIQTFETITEYIQGPCLVNQQVLIQAGFLDQAQILLNQNEIQLHLTDNINLDGLIEFNDNEDLLTSNQSVFTREQYSELKYKCTVTLISLLEARVDDEIVQRMQKALKLDMIKMNLTNLIYTFQVDFSEKYSPELFGQEGSHFRIETGFNLFFIYLNFLKLKNQNVGRVKSQEEDVVMENFSNNIFFRLIKFAQSIVNSLQESARETMRLTFQGQKKTADEKKKHYDDTIIQIDPFKFFKKHTGSIEIMREDEKLEQVYFPIPPYCKLEKDKEARTKFNEVAIRASNKSKVSSLQKEAIEMIKTMKINFKIEQQINRFKTLEVIILNIDLLRDVQFLIALVINILIFLYYQEALDAPIINADGTTTTVYAGSYFEFEDTVNILGVLSIILSGLIVAFFLSRNAPLLIDKAWAGVNKDKLNPILYTKRLLLTIFYVLSDFFALYYIAYGAAAVLGRFVHPFFFCFHLFEVMIRFPVLLNVVKSVWIPKYLILGTGLLWLLFMYMFSVFGYLVLYDSYPQGACDSLWVCFLTTIRSAFQYDSGIGGMLTSSYQAYPGQLGMLIIRFLFDNLFNILILIIMLNIVAGIIIDMFGQLREGLAEYTEDLQNKCFICGHDKETIEKESTNLQDFKDHIKYEHHQWYYIYYIAYILDKDPTEYTGIESYVADMIQNKNINWFPLDKALCFRKGFGENTEKSIGQQMELLNDQVQGLESNLQNLLKEI